MGMTLIVVMSANTASAAAYEEVSIRFILRNAKMATAKTKEIEGKQEEEVWNKLS